MIENKQTLGTQLQTQLGSKGIFTQVYKKASNVANFYYGNDKGPRIEEEKKQYDEAIERAEYLLKKQK